MKNRCTLLAACMLCLGLAACGSSSPITPEGPSYSGGNTAGSGNRTDSAMAEWGGHGFGSGNSADSTTTVISSTETTADGETAERGGYTAGSGN